MIISLGSDSEMNLCYLCCYDTILMKSHDILDCYFHRYSSMQWVKTILAASFISCLIFILQKGIGAYTYLIFIVILIASIIFIVIFVPETKNKTFDEVAQSIAFGRANKGEAFGQDAEELQPMGDSVKA